MILMFVRHAEALSDEITKFGKKQLDLAYEEIEYFKFTKIYCSPLNRCVETANVFSKKLNIGIEVINDLYDREILKNKTPQNEKEKEWYNNYLNPTYSSSDPEGCKEFLARNFKQFKKIINYHLDKNENAVIVAHSCTFYALMAFLNKIYKDQNINWYRLATCGRVYLEINEKV